MINEALIAEKAEKALNQSIDNLITLAKNEIKIRFQAWKAKGELERLKNHLSQVGQICTIASRQPSTVDEIYYPAKIKHGSGVKTIISAEDLLDDKTRIALIQGTAGQGKSVFLRYLCLRDLDYAGKIPIFVELRKIDRQINLLILIKSQIKSLGLEDNLIDIAFDTILKSGSIRLYLDGMDEIKREHALETKEIITTLINRHPKLQIAVTSRPGALSQNLIDMPHLQQHAIAPLSEKDHSGFFTKIGTPLETKERLIASIEKSNAQIKSLLSTPLMLTLLVLTCGHKQDLPDTLPEFYDSLFNLLSSMHDGTKPGFTRQKATNLTNSELEKLFRAFSFTSKELIGKTSLSHTQFEDSLHAALKITDLKCTSEGFRTDITETVCLMVKDGVDTTFTHKSIQEYYTASFIHKIEDDDAAKQVLQTIEGDSIVSWMNELRFLEDFQSLAYEKFIGIPHGETLTNFLYLKNRTKATISRLNIQSLIDDARIRVAQSKITKSFHGLYWSTPRKNPMNRYLPDLISDISREIHTHGKRSPQQALGDQLEFVPLKSLLRSDAELAQRVYVVVQKFCDGLAVKVRKMKERQQRQKRGLIDVLAIKRISGSMV